MNRLALAQRFRQESGSPGTGPSATVGQTGDAKRQVDWIDTAYEDIQNESPNWRFLRMTDQIFALTADKQNYSLSDLGIEDTFASWILNYFGDGRVYLTTNSNEQRIQPILWNAFKERYLYGALRSTTRRPTIVSVAPDNSLYFYPTPNEDYSFVADFMRVPYEMTADADTPAFPERFHMIVVWRALMLYGAYEAADERYSHGQNEYKKLMRRLKLDQLPRFCYGAPLA